LTIKLFFKPLVYAYQNSLVTNDTGVKKKKVPIKFSKPSHTYITPLHPCSVSGQTVRGKGSDPQRMITLTVCFGQQIISGLVIVRN